ncbi:TBC1 domain family member [Balamuthia mandrillaris]
MKPTNSPDSFWKSKYNVPLPGTIKQVKGATFASPTKQQESKDSSGGGSGGGGLSAFFNSLRTSGIGGGGKSTNSALLDISAAFSADTEDDDLGEEDCLQTRQQPQQKSRSKQTTKAKKEIDVKQEEREGEKGEENGSPPRRPPRGLNGRKEEHKKRQQQEENAEKGRETGEEEEESLALAAENAQPQIPPSQANTSSSSSPQLGSAKLKKFEALLAEPVVDLVALRKASWSGIPTSMRGLVWKLLLGYLPSNMDRRDSTLHRKRQEYYDAVPKYFDIAEEDKTEYERALFRQIHIDIPRTHPNVSLFQQEKVQQCIERILYIWAIRHPATGYVQGINDLATPFFVVFLSTATGEDWQTCDVSKVPTEVLDAVEADSYWCLYALLDGIQDQYTTSQPGIQHMIYKLKELIRRIDTPLDLHLEQQEVQFIQFAFRWMNCLLMREVPLPLVIRMWDTYLAEADGFSIFHVYVCASFLTMWSDQLQSRDFSGIMLFFQHLPTSQWTVSDIEMLLSQAFMLKTLYHDSQAHLKP